MSDEKDSPESGVGRAGIRGWGLGVVVCAGFGGWVGGVGGGKQADRCLQHARFSRILKTMEIHFTPDVEKKLNDLAAQSGRGPDELLQDALAGYFDELGQTRDMLNSRYDELKSGRVKPIDGEEAFARLKAKTQA
jgi:predicted transcriptional regulator